jgi:hypothetical protein
LRELGAPERLVNLQLHMIGGLTEARLRGVGAFYVGIQDEQGATRDALWYCYLAVAPGGTPMSLEERMADARARYASDPLVLEVLDGVYSEYADAIERTQERMPAVGLTRD